MRRESFAEHLGYYLKNASVTHVDYRDGKWDVKEFNFTKHLNQ